MYQKILSIIVPVYNVERYIKECYNSIIDDRYNDVIEIILVNDGSTDKSYDICKDLSRNENTILINKENGGLASARTAGYLNAQGKYIMYVDSDDKVNSDTIFNSIKFLENNCYDVIFFDMYKFYLDGRIESMNDNIYESEVNDASKLDAIKHISTRPKFPGSVCSKMYMRNFLEKNNIKFPQDKRIAEDLGYSFDVLLFSKNIYTFNKPLYYYRQNREGSITHRVTFESFLGVSKFIEESLSKENNIKSSLMPQLKELYSFIAYEYSILLWQYNFLGKDEKEKAYRYLKKHKNIMFYAKSKKIKIINFILQIFGIKITAKLLNIIKK